MTGQLNVVVIGATGLFGSLLAQRLAGVGQYRVIGVARSAGKLAELAANTGIATQVVDRSDHASVQTLLKNIAPFAVIDCSGPFQYYGAQPYLLADLVLRAGSHYIDIADDGDFVQGITTLDALAKQRGVVAISGASTVPAISTAVCDQLTTSFAQVYSIETAIFPGNRARRTYSVMKAILGQVGKPFTLMQHGKPTVVYGWTDTKTISSSLPQHQPVRNRLVSLVNTADLRFMSDRYGAHTVATRAGLELKFFHKALQVAGALVRYRLLPSLSFFTGAARWFASLFERIGSDSGGMQITVTGIKKPNGQVGDLDGAENNVTQHTWDLIALDGNGPEIPTLPVSVLLNKLQQQNITPGARACCGDVTLQELQQGFDAIEAHTCVTEQSIQPLFKTVLKTSFDQLPAPVKALHSAYGKTVYGGRAESLGPTGVSGRIAAFIFGFPKASPDVSVKVTVQAEATQEVWVREFAGKRFKSVLSIDSAGNMQERFGALTARLGLHCKNNKLYFPVRSARVFSYLPVPAFLLPKSIAHEQIDAQGRFVFDVHLLTPFGARIAHYRGWLVKESDNV